MIYADTSVWVSLLTHEARASDCAAWFAAQPPGAICTGEWTVTEFASALALKVRSKQLTSGQADSCWRAFEALLDGGINLLAASETTHVHAAALCRRYASGVRAGDAMHLALAREAGVTAFVTLDALQAKQAKALRLKVEAIGSAGHRASRP